MKRRKEAQTAYFNDTRFWHIRDGRRLNSVIRTGAMIRSAGWGGEFDLSRAFPNGRRLQRNTVRAIQAHRVSAF